MLETPAQDDTGKKTPGGAGTHTGQTHEPHKPNPLKTNPPTDSRAPDHTQTAPVHTQPRDARVATNRTTHPIKRGGLGCIRVSNGCHRKFRGHNFDSCVTNFDKISVFLFAPAMANFVDFTATSEFVTAVYEQCAKPHTPRTHDSARRLTRRAARSAAGLWGAGAEDGETV
jgi:hypothetical protein